MQFYASIYIGKNVCSIWEEGNDNDCVEGIIKENVLGEENTSSASWSIGTRN